MDLYILRHGKAEAGSRTGRDADRELTSKGRVEIKKIGLWMASQGLVFEHIATSPLARSHETARIIADELDRAPRPASWDSLSPGGDLDDVIRETGRFSEEAAILLVGHEPALSSLISRVISENDSAAIVMVKGGLAKIRNYRPGQAPSGELHWLLTPALMAGSG